MAIKQFFSREVQVVADTRSKEERSLVRRLDIFLLVFGCISQVIKYLDQSNISNAYVSGMQEDLQLHGNELNYFTTCFNVAYCVMLIPSQIIMTYVRPSWYLPSVEIIWGVVTGLIAVTHHANQVYVLRVFLGLFESAAYPGMITLFMTWYTPLEMAKRIGFYQSCQPLGRMLSGALQAAIVNSMDGRYGLAGWRWLFVVNAIITVVWGLAGFFMIPDSPFRPNPRAIWFKEVHAKQAIQRLEREHRIDSVPITWRAAKRVFTTWLVWVIAVVYIGMVLGTSGIDYFNLFLQSIKRPDGSPRWTKEQVNLIPIGGAAINVVFVWVWAFLSDIFRSRWVFIVLQAIIVIIGSIIMSIWTSHPTGTPLSAAYAAYFIEYIPLGTAPLIWSWLSDLAPQEPEERTLTVGAAIAGYYAISAWSGVLVWPASQAPYYKYGWQSTIAIVTLVIVLTVLLRIVDAKYLKPKRLAQIEEADKAAAKTMAAEATAVEI